MTPVSDATYLHERALALAEDARWQEAEEAAYAALELFEAEGGRYSPDVANVLNLLSTVADARSQPALAEQHASRAWSIMIRLGGRCAGPEAQAIRIEALGRMGSALRTAGRYPQAERWLRQAVDLAEQEGVQVPGALNSLGVLYKYAGNFDAAERLYRRALDQVADDSALAATILHNLGGLAHARGRYAEGELCARRAWEIRRELLGPEHPETLADACVYAAILDGLERFSESEPIYRHALEVLDRLLGPDHVEIAVTLHQLAAVHHRRGDHSQAESLYQSAFEMKRRVLGVEHPDTALTMCSYAALLCDLNRPEQARPLCANALAVLERTLSPDHPRIAAARQIWKRCATDNARAVSACDGPRAPR